jgi:hypothetical protein
MATVTSLPPGGDGLRKPPRPIVWEGMAFRSQAEYRLARALDGHNVWIVPNARGRVGISPRRVTRELDLLVGIDPGIFVGVEIDGPCPQHDRITDEHRRDRLFHAHGVPVEHYGTAEVYEETERVAAEIIMLAKARSRGRTW